MYGSHGQDIYKNITHLILDEVHERERITDFVMIAIKNALHCNPHLKVVLMSATLNCDQFSEYFNKCPVINVPGRLFNVIELFLEDVLLKTLYKTKEMENYMHYRISTAVR